MTLDTGDTAWILVSAALVMIMTPGVGFFYGGMVRRKNVVAMIALSFIVFALVSLQWILWGYSLSFGTDMRGIVGGLASFVLNGVGMTPGPYAPTVPAYAYMLFQLVFATVTLAILTSVFAERVKLSSFLVFGLLWTTFVYDPIAHWVWGGGWMAAMGVLDFAGGLVVHISAGFSALAVAFVIGRRRGYGDHAMEPSNIPIALIGAALLWFGWFGFNGGSALAANGLAASAIVVTNTAAAAGALTWMCASWYHGRPSSLGVVSGAVAGLGAVTPAAGYVGPGAAIIIGVVAALLCYSMMLLRIRKELDESLDAWSIHGMGGLWGVIATGIFATAAVNGATGLLAGNFHQFAVQVIAALATITYAFGLSYALAWVVDRTIGLRVSEDEEYVGLDISQHGERA
jgi:Amt family ammonium transporter